MLVASSEEAGGDGRACVRRGGVEGVEHILDGRLGGQVDVDDQAIGVGDADVRATRVKLTPVPSLIAPSGALALRQQHRADALMRPALDVPAMPRLVAAGGAGGACRWRRSACRSRS